MTTLLKLKKINLKYQTGKKNISVLKNIDLIIKKKETVSVVGESGSGKTSLIMLIGGLERPTSGKIIFKEKEITNLPEDEISEVRKKSIGIIFQSFYLIPNYTAVENVALTLELNKFKNPEKEAKILLDRFGLKRRFNNLPSQLSGGEQQMLAIGRALMSNPKCLLLDEPSLGLAPKLVDQIKEFIVEINQQGVSVLLVEQNANMALSIATHGYIMETGNIVMDNTPEKLLKDEDVREFYLGLNAEGTKRKSFKDVKHYKRKKRWLS